MLVTITYGLLESKASDGHGLAPLASKIQSFFNARVQIMEWTEDLVQFIVDNPANKPLIMMGHSFGGGASVTAARKLMELGVSVDLLILLDPVPTDGWLLPKTSEFVIPDNVADSVCFHRNACLPPWSRPIKSALYMFQNHEMDLGHSEFNGNEEVQEDILKLIKTAEDGYPQPR
jgi:pimeloyl-ACP methyl ester carboxylesterase